VSRLLLVLVLVLLGCSRKAAPDPYAEQKARAEAVGRRALEEADAGRIFEIASRDEVQFGEGFSPLNYNPKNDIRAYPYRWMADHAHVRLKSHPGKLMHLIIGGWYDQKAIRSKIVINLYLDGYVVPVINHGPPPTPLEEGKFELDAYVPAWAMTHEWSDLYLRPSSVSEHWLRVLDLSVIVIDRVEWTEAK